MKHLFTYGSLKPGGHFYPRIEPYVLNPREGTVLGKLYDTGNGWPALRRVYKEEDVAITFGIVYNVQDYDMPTLMAITDGIEGYPNLFDRDERLINVKGNTVWAWVYFGNQESLFKTRIESGEWVIA